ncbi:hypothetical protein NDU88_006884 [Pleurodeles waltl]|uniref:Uncharacterized protein n=1 Tax=Pleurodeles waltl TaxID=8319 RepID=A0AAV7WFS1_PLEWA|nr:hypothetical protein NDU88_006884 [Pleurodeles waltl]
MGPRILVYSLVIVLSILESSYSGPVAIYRFKREVDCKTSAANLNEAVRSVTKAQDVRLETELMMKPYASWEEFLMPAPISIAILGELAAISSAGGDFSINLNPPKSGFKYMKYPESFAATLMQVCNKAWSSFSTANKNMDQIRLLSGSMPSATKEIVTILFQKTDTVNALLPRRLSAFLSVSNECVSLAQSVEMAFSGTIHLVQEVLEACLNSKKGYETKLTDVKIALEQLTIRESSAHKTVKMAEEFRNATKKQLDDASAAYKDALKKVPSVWETMTANFVGGILDALSITKYNNVDNTHSPASGAAGAAGKDDVKSNQATLNICSKSNQLTAITEGLRKVLDSTKESINMKIVYDEREQSVTTNHIKGLVLFLKKDIADEVECKAQTMMDNVLQSAIAICEDLERVALSNNNTDVKELKSIAQRLHSLFSNSLKTDTYCKQVTNSQPLQQVPPNAARTQGRAGIGTQSAEMAEARVEQATLQLEKTRDMYMDSFENLKKENAKLTEILVEMKSHNLEKIDFDTAKNMLIKGLDSLGKVKEQWEKMILFFQMISNLINSCLDKNVNELVQSVTSVQTIPNYSNDAFVKDMLYNQAFKASNIANLVNMISSTYCEVSQRYLMDRVSTLGRLLTMNPSNPEFQIEREKLQSGCTEAQQSIQKLVISKKQEFDMNIEARVHAINCQLGAAIPPISTAEKKQISEAVNAGASAAKDSSNMDQDISSFV